MSKGLKYILYTILPGLFLYLAWPPKDFYILSFIALVPLFIMEKDTDGKKGFFWMLYGALLLFNVLTTWWVWYASPAGAIAMLVLNSLLMTLPFVLYRKARRRFGLNKAFIAFVCFWLAFEYLHLNWEITWPWLSLGNVFAKHNYAVQWYEYTGMLGGTLWVLIANILAYKLFSDRRRKQVVYVALLITLPIGVSVVLKSFQNITLRKLSQEVVVLQPNLDPYLEKFNMGQEVKAIQDMLVQAEEAITENTVLVIMPETAIVEYVDEDRFDRSTSIRLLRSFVLEHPNVRFITGASTYNFYEEGQKKSPTARKTKSGDFYESYNTSLEISANGVENLYHKSKLVPGVEKMPYPQIFSFLEYFTLDMGGISGSLGSDDSVTVFTPSDANMHNVKNRPDLAPLICYESVFPDVVRQFGAKGAELILVMTNDGWWRDTDGYKQHMYYACLRAIENRQQVVRAANTGISCHIDETGRILERTDWWVKDTLRFRVNPIQAQTFYSRHGDYIGKIGSFLAVFFLLGWFVLGRVKH